MFYKGQVVKLVGYSKSYKVLVTGKGDCHNEFAGVIIETEYDDNYKNGELSVGTYATDYHIGEFKKVN
jgi:effector-binding domain-containing protein